METLLRDPYMSYTDKACDIAKQYEDLTREIIEKNSNINLLELVAVAMGAIDYMCSTERIKIGMKNRITERKNKIDNDTSNSKE